MKLEQRVPLLLVERQALNEAREGERYVNIPVFPNVLKYMITLLGL